MDIGGPLLLCVACTTLIMTVDDGIFLSVWFDCYADVVIVAAAGAAVDVFTVLFVVRSGC